MLYAIETSEFLGWLDKRPSQGSAARQNRKNLVFNEFSIHQSPRHVQLSGPAIICTVLSARFLSQSGHLIVWNYRGKYENPISLLPPPAGLSYCAVMELISVSSRSAADPV
jgi:hypothetical protein